MQFIDSHIHLQDYKSTPTQKNILAMRKLGFCSVVNVSSKLEDFSSVASNYEHNRDLIIPAFGLHPWYLAPDFLSSLKDLSFYLEQYPTSWVGEVGLDSLCSTSMPLQIEAFKAQANLASKFSRVLNIHLVKSYGIFQKLLPLMPKFWVMHSFYGSSDYLKMLLKQGAYISFSPKVLKYPKGEALIKEVPLNRLLIESDAPDNSDFSLLPDFYQKISLLKSIDLAKFNEQIINNLKEITVA